MDRLRTQRTGVASEVDGRQGRMPGVLQSIVERLATGRKLLERVARLKLTSDGPNGLSLGRLMKDSSFEDVLESLRTAAEFDHAEQNRRAADQFQVILGLGASIGLMFAFLQIFPQLKADAGLNEQPSRAAVLLIAGFLLSWVPFLFVLWNRPRR